MKTFYDVQQFLKRFGIIVYMGKRLYDIELMKLELSRNGYLDFVGTYTSNVGVDGL